MRNEFLHGIIPPIVTPLVFTPGEEKKVAIDKDGTKRLLKHLLIDGNPGLPGIFLLGSTGEAANLSYDLKRDFVWLCCDIILREDNDFRKNACHEKCDILVGVSSNCCTEIIDLAREAKKAGATAVVLLPPYYFQPSQAELMEHYVDFLVPQIELPILLYNIPQMTKTWWEIDTLRTINAKYCHQKIIGIKDSSGDLEYFRKLCQLNAIDSTAAADANGTKNDDSQTWTILQGLDHLLLDSLELGGHGGINGGANVEPKLYVSFYNKAKEMFLLREGRKDDGGTNGDGNDIEKLSATVADHMHRIKELQKIHDVGKPSGAFFIKGVKSALQLKNVLSQENVLAPPFSSLSLSDQDKVKAVLEGLPEVVMNDNSTNKTNSRKGDVTNSGDNHSNKKSRTE